MSEGLLEIFGLLVGIAIPLASLAAGLRSKEPFWLWTHPRALAPALLALLLVVPVLTALLVEVLSPNDVYVRAGIMVAILSIGIGPPDLLERTHADAAPARYAVGLEMVLLPLAIVFMPLAVLLHGAVFQHDIELPVLKVSQVVLLQALLPFFVGLAVARFLPKHVEPLSRYAERFVKASMLLVVIFALLVAWRPLLGLGVAAWLTCAVIAVVAILVGHALGGPDHETRTLLASYSAIRFPGLALLLASVVPGGQILIPVVLAYVIASAALVGAYRLATARATKSSRSRPVMH